MNQNKCKIAGAPAGVWPLLLLSLGYRIPMPVTEVMVFSTQFGTTGYYVCPRCAVTMEREFMFFCVCCGQRLDWRRYKQAKIVYPGRRNQSA